MSLTISVSPGSAFTDFNEVDERDRLAVSRSQYRGWAPRTGKTIHLRDHEGNEVDAEIESVKPKVLTVRPIWSTWTDAPQHQVLIERNVRALAFSPAIPAPLETEAALA